MQVRGAVGRNVMRELEIFPCTGWLPMRGVDPHACYSSTNSTDVAYQDSWRVVTYEWTDLEQALCLREVHRVKPSNPMTYLVLPAPTMVYSYLITGILNVLCPLINQWAKAPITTAPKMGPA